MAGGSLRSRLTATGQQHTRTSDSQNATRIASQPQGEFLPWTDNRENR